MCSGGIRNGFHCIGDAVGLFFFVFHRSTLCFIDQRMFCVLDGNNQKKRTSRKSSRKSVLPITAVDEPVVLHRDSESEEAKESNANAIAKQKGKVVQRVKILVSTKDPTLP